ncbi:MAG: hypothetical protein VB035_12775 [Candidatus Fimivivens sp.]|nr:hypothetical protein [Candidatus Fimivivens sp.]
MNRMFCKKGSLGQTTILLAAILLLCLSACKSSENVSSLISCETLAVTSEQAASDKLLAMLKAVGYPTDGTAIMLEEHADWKDGGKAWFFAWGNNTPEKFTAEERFAVTETGSVFKYNILTDDWALLQ